MEKGLVLDSNKLSASLYNFVAWCLSPSDKSVISCIHNASLLKLPKIWGVFWELRNGKEQFFVFKSERPHPPAPCHLCPLAFCFYLCFYVRMGEQDHK